MNLHDEFRGIIEVNINEQKLADKIYDKGVEPLIQKLLDLIPTEIDNAFYEGKKEELRILFSALIVSKVAKVEEVIDGVLDEKTEA